MRALAVVSLSALLFSCGKTGGEKQTDAETEAEQTSTVAPLHVQGTALLYANGDTAVLTGPSLGWHSNWKRFYNPGTVKALKEKWGANITRAAIGAHQSGDITGTFDVDSAKAVNLASTVIDVAIDNGMEWTEEELKERARLARKTTKERNNVE